jgi:hypothetical protein
MWFYVAPVVLYAVHCLVAVPYMALIFI